jgi:hypothetical protein
MQTVGLYGHDGSLLSAAWAEGARAAGWSLRFRSGSDFRHGDTEDFDVAVVMTMRAGGALIVEEYGRRRPIVPTFVVDYGYLRRVMGIQDFYTGHWQVSLGGLNSPPPGPCLPDRWEALGLDVVERGGDPDGVVLVCGQFPDDQSHGLGRSHLEDWADEVCASYLERGERVRFRPHPAARDIRPTIADPRLSVDEDPRAAPIAVALLEAKLLVTLCSTAGIDALLAGVPAVATLPGNAAWGDLSGDTLPPVEARVELFRRLAYGQWTFDEIRRGDWFAWYESGYEGVPLPEPPALQAVPMEPSPTARGGMRGGRHGSRR